MGFVDAFFTSAQANNPSNSQTLGVSAEQQTSVSEFLTVQSLTNFAAITGAITIAWKALKAVSSSDFSSQWTPFVMAFVWFAVSLIATAAQQDKSARVSIAFWATGIFIGIINALVLFGAVIGLN
jgi:hypothetical protein